MKIAFVGAKDEGSNATGVNAYNDLAADAGAVYVFTRIDEETSAVWSQQAYLKASNTDAYDEFGVSVSLSADGNTLAVAANGESSNAIGINGDKANNSAISAGAVYVFDRTVVESSVGSGAVWFEQAYLKACNTDVRDRFGVSVSISADGNTLAVAAYSEDSNATGINGHQSDNRVLNSGAVYTFTRSAASWSHQAYIKASNTGVFDSFGSSVALSSDGVTLAVGAYAESSNATGLNADQEDNSARQAGAVYVY